MTQRATAAQVVARLSTEDKVRLLSGRNFWSTRAVPGVASVMLTDGPHGLRKQAGSGDHLGLAESVPATCFPPAAGLGATWDLELLEEIGEALGREAAAEQVGVLLGPGLNIKRHPAGGRNFEYFSEDPLLSGKTAAAMVRGIQSQGVGACLKHFAANNQEFNRMRVDTVVDERTLREVYLAGFEIAVTESSPWTVMSSYNLLNGEHTGESYRLLTEILRDEWGFDGVVMSDWFGTADRAVGVRAGMDLEMPGSNGSWNAEVHAALESGALSHADLDRACERLVEMVQRVARDDASPDEAPGAVDHDAHHALARRAAAAATVLLTNDGLLPLAGTGRVALLGAMASTPRFQGAGSSLVNATRVDSVLDSLRSRLEPQAQVEYVAGYDPASGEATPADLAAARTAAAEADVAVVVVGLPARHESEGFDRTTLRLPAGHDALVEAVLAVNPRTVVVLVNGAPVEVPWADRPAALVEAYLGGQAGGSGLVDVLTGDAEPGGRLAESFPVSGAELPASANFADHPTQVQYRETFHVGYRFHDTCGVAPRFAFGHGLSYTTFSLGGLTVSGSGQERQVEVTVTNTGERAGSTVVQVYVHDVASSVPRPEQELKAFAKVHLEPGEARRVQLDLGRRGFAVYDTATAAWAVEAGEFEIRVGTSSRDLPLRSTVVLDSPDTVTAVEAPSRPLVDDAEFAVLLGRSVPAPRPLLPFHRDSTLSDLDGTWLGARLQKLLLSMAGRRVSVGDDANSAMMETAMAQMPLRGVVMAAAGRLTYPVLDRAISVLNAARRGR
ncbi:MAG: glycoside hydrolase family 3 C-terminal domain-containing protein [Nocardioides sp.]|uniref:glycoside hydrolase family 3 C-terminal domain-containing protein n=1 Tax=Nocardioides sp. TaxID=35761 RepID=UPI003EFF79F5